MQELLSGQELLESTSTLKRELMQLTREMLEKELAHQHLNAARHQDRDWQRKKPLLMTLVDNLVERSADTLSFRHN